MSTFLKLFLALVLLPGCGKPKPSADGKLPVPDSLKELSTAEAREMLPKAASLSREEFSEILDSPPVTIAGIKNQSLTALLLAVDPLHAREQNPNATRDFQYLAPSGYDPAPQMIQAAVRGEGDADYVSLIQPEYITKCTCENRGDTANGHVEYRAGNLYAGSADFTAQRQGDHWEIVAFHLPEYRLATHRQPDGNWRLESEEQLLGIVSR